MTEPEGGYVIPQAVIDEMVEYARTPLPSLFRTAGDGPHYGRYRISRRRRLSLRIGEWRERIGFAIAGYTPTDDDY